MATPHAKMEEEGLPKVRTWAWGRAKWRRRAAATATHGVPAESAMDGSHPHEAHKAHTCMYHTCHLMIAR